MQFGVELGNFKWSPIKFKYPQWAGLYTHSSDQNIYVNRGLGHLGYAGRVGIYPEITIITIQSNQT
jgi:predicted MPP superfamily phosphohydrolase